MLSDGSLKPGDFVSFVSTFPSGDHELVFSPRCDWGCDAGIVVAVVDDLVVVKVNSVQGEFSDYFYDRYEARRATEPLLSSYTPEQKNRFSLVSKQLLRQHAIVTNTFPILDLPLPALALVIHSLGLHGACWASMTCRKFLSAFRHELIWKEKAICLHNETKEKKENGSGTHFFLSPFNGACDWWTAYRQLYWRITVVTMFHHMRGCSISGSFFVNVLPTCSVQHLVHLFNSHKDNRQTGKGEWLLEPNEFKPHNPNRVGAWGRTVEESSNCKFEIEGKDLAVLTVAEAGLCDGAILEIGERMMCD